MTRPCPPVRRLHHLARPDGVVSVSAGERAREHLGHEPQALHEIVGPLTLGGQRHERERAEDRGAGCEWNREARAHAEPSERLGIALRFQGEIGEP